MASSFQFGKGSSEKGGKLDIGTRHLRGTGPVQSRLEQHTSIAASVV